MNAVSRFAACAIAAFSVAASSAAVLSPVTYHYLDGARVNGVKGSPVLTPSADAYSFKAATSLTFTALPPAGRKTSGWVLVASARMVYGQNLSTLSANATFGPVDTITVTGYDENGIYYLCPCFEWLAWRLAYQSQSDSISGAYGWQNLTYTNSVTLASPEQLWPKNPTGYDFAGWATAPGGPVAFTAGQTVANAGQELGATDGAIVYLYAVWAKRAMQIMLDSQGGLVDADRITAYIDGTYSLPEPVRKGYKFLGWYTALSGGTRISSGDAVTRDDINVLHARWEPKQVFNFTLNWLAGENGDPVSATQQVYENDDVELPGMDVVNTWTGHTFLGWDGDCVNITAHGEATAVYRTNEYDVVYYSGGGQGKMDAQHFVYGAAQQLTENAFTYGRTGAWRFAGWATNDVSETIVYTNGQEVVNLTAADGAVFELDALWTNVLTECSSVLGTDIFMEPSAADGYVAKGDSTSSWLELTNLVSISGDVIGPGTLKFSWKAECNDSKAPEDITGRIRMGLAVNGEKPSAMPEYPKATNEWQDVEIEIVPFGSLASHLEWMVWRDFSGFTSTPADVLKSNTVAAVDYTLCLKDVRWEPQGEFAVAFDANGGDGAPMPAARFYAGEYNTLPRCTYSKTGYSFGGWLDAASGLEYADRECSNTFAPATLAAQWKPIGYIVRFDANGGAGTMADLAMAYDAAAKIPACAFTRDGFDFAGWSSGGAVYADGAEIVNLATDDGAVVVLSAVWNERPPEKGKGVEGTESAMFPGGIADTGEFAAQYAATYNGWLRDKSTGAIGALLKVKTTAVRKGGAVSKATITVTPLNGKKRTYKTSVAAGDNPVDEFGIIYGRLGLTGEFMGYLVEAALDGSKAKSGTAERTLASSLPQGVWGAAFDTGSAPAVFSISVGKNGKAKVVAALPGGAKFTSTSQGIAGSDGVFAIPVLNAKNSVGFVLWLDAAGNVSASDVANPAWTPAAAAKVSNLSGGTHSLSMEMPKWRDYIAVTDLDGVDVTPAAPGLFAVAGTKWTALKPSGRLSLDGSVIPAATFVKVSNGKAPANLAALKISYAPKTGVVRGSFKLWHFEGGKLRADKATIAGVAIDGVLRATATVKKLGSFPVTSED